MIKALKKTTPLALIVSFVSAIKNTLTTNKCNQNILFFLEDFIGCFILAIIMYTLTIYAINKIKENAKED